LDYFFANQELAQTVEMADEWCFLGGEPSDGERRGIKVGRAAIGDEHEIPRRHPTNTSSHEYVLSYANASD